MKSHIKYHCETFSYDTSYNNNHISLYKKILLKKIKKKYVEIKPKLIY